MIAQEGAYQKCLVQTELMPFKEGTYPKQILVTDSLNEYIRINFSFSFHLLLL